MMVARLLIDRMRACVFVLVIVIVVLDSLLPNRLLQRPNQIRRINKRHDPIQVNRTPQPLVHPENRGDVPGVCEAGCFQQDVVEGSVAFHQGFQGVDARVFDGAADAAVGEVEPFGCGAGAGGDG
jgi:hypothetical protein